MVGNKSSTPYRTLHDPSHVLHYVIVHTLPVLTTTPFPHLNSMHSGPPFSHNNTHTAAYSLSSTLPLELVCGVDCPYSHLSCQSVVALRRQWLGEDVGEHVVRADVV